MRILAIHSSAPFPPLTITFCGSNGLAAIESRLGWTGFFFFCVGWEVGRMGRVCVDFRLIEGSVDRWLLLMIMMMMKKKKKDDDGKYFGG